jgi:uncharacterized protein (DUF2267 family)
MPTAGAAETVRERVALADRLRRGRETSRRLWRAAPIAAAACAFLAAGARWTGRSPLVPLTLLGVSLGALAIYAYVSRRERAISDATAIEIDRLAGLSGELRSASWFSATGIPGNTSNDAPWVDFHLARAADRLAATDWPQLYPPVAANRAKAATAVLVIAALVLALPVGGRAGLRATGSGSGAGVKGALTAAEADALTAELRKQIEELLKKAERGDPPGTAGALTVAEVRDLLAKLAQAQALQNAKDAKGALDANAKKMGMSSEEMKNLADRLKKAGEISSLSPEVKDALTEAAQKLSDMSETEPSTPQDPNDAMGAAAAQPGDAAQGKKGDKAFDDSSIKSAKDASAGGGAGVVMMAKDSPEGGQEAGLGLGGASARNKGGGTMPDLGAALRKETIEAYKEDTGEKTELDLRRKTEKGTATIGYASTAATAFDKGRATAPPAVPENRRAAVQTYFIRKQ